jgi:hypothetical protein
VYSRRGRTAGSLEMARNDDHGIPRGEISGQDIVNI